MAIPMTPDQIISQLKKWGVAYYEVPNWRTHERDDATGLMFSPVYGCITHHTGSDASDSSNRELIHNGRPDLKGPLAQFGLNDNGLIDLHSAGRANHAGGGDPRVLRAVQNESYEDYPPEPRYHQGSPGAYDGNDVFYGCECYYSGSTNMTKEAYAALVHLWAAICDFHGWSAKSVIGHKEWSDWKPDPGQIDMKVLRSDVQAALDKGAPVSVAGPKIISPNIRAAIKSNIAYDKALDKIKAKRASQEVIRTKAELRRQRKALRKLERNE